MKVNKLKILIVGSGGREHALAWKIKQSKKVGKIFITPGNAGTAQIGQNVNIAADDLNPLLNFAQKEKIDLTVVGPEMPLALGIVDLFEKNGLAIFGPTKKAAQIEASKVFAKRFMKKFKIPTADFKVFSNFQKARHYLKNCQFPQVLKADGLAAGKGVSVCWDKKEGLRALRKIMMEKKFGEAGDRLVIEECLFGPEASVLCFTDGQTVLPLLAAQDHKPIFDADQGPNTGGMGAYAPTPLIDEKLMKRITKKILKPAILGMKKIGRPYKGILYAGLMLNNEGPKVLEFNCRFGDPETQPQLMLLKSDLVDLLLACIEGKLKNKKINWYPGYSVCVVLASGGYPEAYQKGFDITGLPKRTRPDLQIFHAGTKLEKGKVVTDGGRVLGVTSRAPTLKQAIKKAYLKVKKIKFKNKYHRTDIAAKAFRPKICLDCDHAGFELKKAVNDFLIKEGYQVLDLGAHHYHPDDDYPDYAVKVCQKVQETKGKGILICGTGQGMDRVANKIPGIYAEVCWDKATAKHAKKHSNANVFCFGEKIVKPSLAKKMVKIWLETPFIPRPRHLRRLNKTKKNEKGYTNLKLQRKEIF